MTAIAVLKGVDRDEPEMREARSNDWIVIFFAVEPFDEGAHFLRQALGGRCLIMHLLTANRPETTCIGPALSSRHPPTTILDMPLRPVGNIAACHANNRSSLVFNASRPALTHGRCSGFAHGYCRQITTADLVAEIEALKCAEA